MSLGAAGSGILGRLALAGVITGLGAGRLTAQPIGLSPQPRASPCCPPSGPRALAAPTDLIRYPHVRVGVLKTPDLPSRL